MQYPLQNIKITQGFGADPNYYRGVHQNGHNGIDFACPTGTPVYAADDGVVFFEGYGYNSNWMSNIAGICCIIDHGKVYTGYAHLKDTVINRGQRVKRGQLIGHSDNTGLTTGPHLHFEVIGKPPIWTNGYAGRIKPPVLTAYKAPGAIVKAPIVQRVIATAKAILPSYYKVRAGDNLTTIASKYKTNWKQLQAWNKSKYPSLISNPNYLNIGWSLRVK